MSKPTSVHPNNSDITITVIGRGNVASHLVPAMRGASMTVNVLTRTDISEIKRGEKPLPVSEIYIISVSDDAIGEILNDLPDTGALWLHTAGSVGVEIFKNKRQRGGSLYPLQTFTKGSELNIAEIPFLIESLDDKDYALIEQIAKRLSSKVIKADSATRAKIHLAAVFACNFVCHMLTCADETLQSCGLEIDLMRPLVEETIRKAMQIGPAKAQTGPAARADLSILQKQISLLSGYPSEIYRIVSSSIMHSKQLEDTPSK